MKKNLILLFLFIPLFSFANDLKTMSADYEVSFGIFGKIGKAHCEFVLDKGTYKISIDVKSSGIVKFFSQDRHEVYESTGLVKNGTLIPDLFVKNREWGSHEISKKYFIDHDKKIVSVLRTNSSGNIKKDKLSYFSDNDILTLFFNLDKVLEDKGQLEKGVKLRAIGANKENGNIDIKYPTDKEKKSISKLLGVSNNLLLVTLNQKIFSSKKGEFMIDIDTNGVCDRFILKDVLLYGDLYGEIKNFKIKE